MINNIKNSRIYINTNDIQILDFNKNWKLIRTSYMGEAKTIYSKEEADNIYTYIYYYMQNIHKRKILS